MVGLPNWPHDAGQAPWPLETSVFSSGKWGWWFFPPWVTVGIKQNTQNAQAQCLAQNRNSIHSDRLSIKRRFPVGRGLLCPAVHSGSMWADGHTCDDSPPAGPALGLLPGLWQRRFSATMKANRLAQSAGLSRVLLGRPVRGGQFSECRPHPALIPSTRDCGCGVRLTERA